MCVCVSVNGKHTHTCVIYITEAKRYLGKLLPSARKCVSLRNIYVLLIDYDFIPTYADIIDKQLYIFVAYMR